MNPDVPDVAPLRHRLILQLYLGTCAPFVVPIFGTTLMPAAPGRPGKNAFHALLRGQHEAPEEAPNLPDTQSHRSPRAALKGAKLLGADWIDVFFGASLVGRWTARSTVNSA